MTLDDKLSIMFMQQLELSNKVSTIQGSTADLATRLTHVEKLCAQAWRMNKSQIVSTAYLRFTLAFYQCDCLYPFLENCPKPQSALSVQADCILCQPRSLREGTY